MELLTSEKKKILQDDREYIKEKKLIYDVIGAGWKVMISS